MNSIGDKPAPRLRILSRSGEPFRDRAEAGQLLARELGGLKGQRALVLGIPRGGIIVAMQIASRIDGDLDIVLARKLGTPGHEELAMGALSEGGAVFLNQNVVDELGIGDIEIQREKARQLSEIQRRIQVFRQALPRTPLKGRTVVVTDDGVATGATMQAALWAIRKEKPRLLIAALPVASEEAVERLASEVDEVVCLRLPDYFAAVGQFYQIFDQITDEEVLETLREEAARRKMGGAKSGPTPKSIEDV